MKWLLIILGLLALPIVAILVIGACLPKQHTASRSLQLRQSPETIYALISGPSTWRSGIRSYEPVAKIDGKTAWREVDKHNSAITYVEDEATPPTRRVTRIADKKLPFGGTWTYEISPAPGGSVLRITENGDVYNPAFRFVSRYLLGHTATVNQYLRDVAAHFNQPADILN